MIELNLVRSLIVRELIVCLLMGGAPMLLAFGFGSLEEMEKIITALMAPDLLVYYYLGLTAAYIVFWGVEYYLMVHSARAKYTIAFCRWFLEPAGSGTLGIYRLAAGILLVFAPLWMVFEPGADSAIRAGLLFFLGIGAFCSACFFAWLHEWMMKRTRTSVYQIQAGC